MIKVILIIVACQAPDFTNCQWMEAIDLTAAGPIECQKARIPASGWWRHEIQVEQGFKNWSVFTRCELGEEE